MIRYALICERGHEFESWFQDSAAYDKQAKRGLVTCPAMRLEPRSRRQSWRRGLSATAKKQRAPIEAPAANGETSQPPCRPLPSQ